MNILKKVFILLIAITAFTFTETIAQQQITGSVVDNNTGGSLPGATVLQRSTQNGTTTDLNGQFNLTTLANAPQQLDIRYVGYQPFTLSLDENQSTYEIRLVPIALRSDDVVVTAHRVDSSSPVTFTDITREQIEERNLGQDLPMLLEMAPSVVATSDAGAGIGYTGLRIRGVDPSRINVTINGIPLNDSESHGVFFVNLPDFASSIEYLQIQRGVGTSTNGPASFGASVNIQTGSLRAEPYASLNNTIGSYNTRKHNILAGTGLLNNGWTVDARLSMVKSDGYIDRAFSDLSSYALSASRYTERSFLKFNVLSGREQTYQAWNGVPEEMLSENRRFNEFTYDNQTDNYRQDHYQMHYSYQLSDLWAGNFSLHYTYGRGYFEEFRANDRLSSYGLPPIELGDELAPILRTDIIRRRWLDNHFYGAVFSTEYRNNNFRWITGGAYNEYDGDHFGEIVWARFAGDTNIRDRYYDNNGFKTDGNIYTKVYYSPNDRFTVYGDLQVRRIYYRFLGFDRNLDNVTQDDELFFFNPKFGGVYNLNESSRLYASFGIAGKEPTRREYTRSTPDDRPRKETLYNVEVGYRSEFTNGFAGINLYYMYYDDQLILTGEINEIGQTIRTNVPESYRRGIELEAGYQFTNWLQWSGNTTFSENKISSFTEFLDDFDAGEQQVTEFKNTDIAFSPSVIAASQFRLTQGDFRADIMSRYVSKQYLDNTSTSSRSIDPYFVTDIQLSYRLDRVVPYIRSAQLSLKVNNVFNALYESNGYTFGFIAGGEVQRFNYYYPQAERNVLLSLSLDF